MWANLVVVENANRDAALVSGEFSAGVAEDDWGGKCAVSFDVWRVSGGYRALGFARLWVADGMLGNGSFLESSRVLSIGYCYDWGFELDLVCTWRQEVRQTLSEQCHAEKRHVRHRLRCSGNILNIYHLLAEESMTKVLTITCDDHNHHLPTSIYAQINRFFGPLTRQLL